MKDTIQSLTEAIKSFAPASAAEVEEKRIAWLGKKGLVTELFEAFRDVPVTEKKETGRLLNELKQLATTTITTFKEEFSTAEADSAGMDITLPASPLVKSGSRHPISLVRNQIVSIFGRIGFSVSEGNEIEDDWHNFTALNTPEDHPARDMQDTFYVNEDPAMVLRTQTSSVQVHIMQNQKPPIRTISPGRVYRNEAISARAHCQFHQVEGLYIDEQVSFADLKQTLLYFAKEMFGQDIKIRLRPSYFPFTEPSAEMDISCSICKGDGCNVCKHTGWVEILGCGMVDPQVLQNCGIDPVKYKGFAFGMGIERITMLKYEVKDLRLFFDNDVRFLSQFESAG